MMSCHTKLRSVKFPPEPWVKRAQELRAVENYDGQGKSMQQETNDTMVMLAMVLIFVVTIGFTALAIYLGVTWVGQ